MIAAPLWQISVATTCEAEDAVAVLIEEVFGQPAILTINAETGRTTATVYCQKKAECSAAKQSELARGLKNIRACGLPIGPGKVLVKKVRREDWAESWKKHFRPLEIGAALLIKPSWIRRKPRPGQAVVVLDPGLSFGTGQHPTTRFCLEQIVRCRRSGQVTSLLDIGAGSGILAISAVKLGYSPVHAFDFDPEAVRVANENAKMNRVQHSLQFLQVDLARSPMRSARYHVVCANLTHDVLIDHQKRILHRLHRDGVLVLAGILSAQFDKVRRIYERAGWKLLRSRREKEWRSGAFVLAP